MKEVNGKDYCIPYIMENTIHVWNHQPVDLSIWANYHNSLTWNVGPFRDDSPIIKKNMITTS